MAGRFGTLQLAAIVVFAAGTIVACRPSVDQETAAGPPLPHVRVAEVVDVALRPESRHLVLLQPRRRARLSPRVGGEIVAIDVVDQQEVAAQQRLVRFARTDARGGVLVAKASVTRIQAQLQDTQSQLQRVRTLAERGVETAREVERLETEQATLQAQLHENRAQLVRAHDRADATELLAPFAGVVTRIDAELGEYVGAGTPVVVVSQLDPLALEFSLTEDAVALHDRGGLRFSATVRGEPVPVTIEWVSREAETGTSMFPVRLEVPNDAGRLRAGESAEVQVFGALQQPQPMVPATAIRWSAGESFVFRVVDDKVERVPVRVGEDTGTGVVVEGALRLRDKVIRTGPTNLDDGDRVVVVDDQGEQLAQR